MCIKNISYLFIFCTILLSCTNEYPEPIQESPIYFIDGTINGVHTNMSAGDNGIEQTTEKHQNSMGVYEYSSSLGNLYSTDATIALLVKINGASIKEMNQGENVNDAIHTGTYDFTTYSNLPDISSFKLYADCSDPSAIYNWSFNELINPTQEQNPTFISTPLTGMDSVNLALLLSNGASFNSSQYILNMGLSDLLQNIEYTIEATDTEFKITPNFSQIPSSFDLTSFDVSWGALTNVNSTTSTQISIPISYNNNVFLQTIFHDNTTNSDYFHYIRFTLDQAFNGTIKLGKIRYQPLDLNLGNIEIQYRNTTGNIYTTIGSDNSNPNNKFIINEILEGETSPSGRPTKLVKASFSCYLTNQVDNTDIIYFENITANLAFEY